MSSYRTTDAFCTGSSHIKAARNCEDRSASYSDGSIHIADVSDGHGDKNCVRSASGATIACEIAVILCREFAEQRKAISDESLSSLEAEISKTWRSKVLTDAEEIPFEDAELSSVDPSAAADYRSGRMIERAYGCTLLVAAVLHEGWFFLQIGDGGCAAIFEEGVYVEPVDEDDECVGNRSSSICAEDSHRMFRHFFSRYMPRALFVFSDGLEESFDQMGRFRCLFSIAKWIQDCPADETAHKLDDLLSQISEGGSGDDVSIACIVSDAEDLAGPRRSMADVDAQVAAAERELADSRVRREDAEDMIAELQRQEDSIRAEIADLQMRLGTLESAKEDASTSLSMLSAEEEEMRQRVDRAQRYRDAASLFWREHLDRIGLK